MPFRIGITTKRGDVIIIIVALIVIIKLIKEDIKQVTMEQKVKREKESFSE